jgi:hypothetical protein
MLYSRKGISSFIAKEQKRRTTNARKPALGWSKLCSKKLKLFY